MCSPLTPWGHRTPLDRALPVRAPLAIGRAAIALAATTLLCGFSGCRKTATVAAPPKPKSPPHISDADLKRYKPNEAGAIMIVMYHNFDAKKPNADLNRQPNLFRKDLDDFYQRGYRPVTVSELIENRMDVPAGKTPIALTFDDALPTQLRIVNGPDGAQKIDRDCAVGMMETFHKDHPDWPLKGTFFVLPNEGRRGRDPFGQPETVRDKFDYLLQNGYEIANHTSTHASLRRLPPEKIRWELATALRDIKQIVPKAVVQVMALPYGDIPRNPEAVKALVTGSDGGTSYSHKAVLRAAWRPVLSPITRADKKLSQQGTFCIFDPYRLERIKPNPKEANKPGTLEYYLAYFDQHPNLRYISDGNPQVAAVPASLKTEVDEARVRSQKVILQPYSFSSTDGGAKGGGSSLHVE